MELQVTTIGAFMKTVDQDHYFLVEKHQHSDGYSTKLVALRECDISEVAGQWITVLWDERAEYAVLALLNRADAPSIVVVSAGLALSEVRTPCFTRVRDEGVSRPKYLYPVCNPEKITTNAEMLAVLNEEWKQDDCVDAAELVREAGSHAQLDFDAKQPVGSYWTDDELEYVRIFSMAYAQAYQRRVFERHIRKEHGHRSGDNAY